MFTQTPSQAINMMAPSNYEVIPFLKMTRECTKFYAEHAHTQPTEKHFAELVAYYQENADITCTSDQVKAIVALAPHFRIKLAEYDGLGDTEVRDMASDALAAFLLNTNWPMYGDKIDIDQFFARSMNKRPTLVSPSRSRSLKADYLRHTSTQAFEKSNRNPPFGGFFLSVLRQLTAGGRRRRFDSDLLLTYQRDWRHTSWP